MWKKTEMVGEDVGVGLSGERAVGYGVGMAPLGQARGAPTRAFLNYDGCWFVDVIDAQGIEMAMQTTKIRSWTKEDIRALKTLAREKTKTTVIARKLKRSVPATYQQASKLGVALGGPRKKRGAWTWSDGWSSTIPEIRCEGRMSQKDIDACFEIKVDGKARSYRDQKETAIEAGKYLKQMQPKVEVSIRDLRDNSVTMIDGEKIIALNLGAGGKSWNAAAAMAHRFDKIDLTERILGNALLRSQSIYYLAWLPRGRSRRGPLHALGIELLQELLEAFLSSPAGHRHGLKIDRRVRYRAWSSGAINLPPPWFRRRCPVLHDDWVIRWHTSQISVAARNR
jgi:hypothetical protein